MNVTNYMQQELQTLKEHSNLRRLPQLTHEGRTVVADGRHMLNLSSNDYLGLAADRQLKEEFLQALTPDTFLPTSSSSRLLTGNFGIYEELETELATLFGTETALVLNSGYHANMGILPAVSDTQTLILADKLVHASIIDGIRLSTARCIRFRHNDLVQLERLLEQHHATFRQLIIVTESIFSMDGDQADLTALVRLKKRYSNVLLYVDEAHAFGVRGPRGLGCAEETGCIPGYRFPRGHLRQGSGVCRRIHRLLPDDTRVSRQPDANPHLHHGIASDKYCLDTVYRTETCQNAGPPRASGKNQPDTARSITSQGVRMPQRKPYRPTDYRPQCRHRAVRRVAAEAWLLCTAGTPAHGARRDITYPLLADSGHYRTRDRRNN